MAPAAARQAGRRGPVLLKLAPSSPRPRSSPAAASGGDVPALTGGRARRAEPAARGCASELSIKPASIPEKIILKTYFAEKTAANSCPNGMNTPQLTDYRLEFER